MYGSGAALLGIPPVGARETPGGAVAILRGSPPPPAPVTDHRSNDAPRARPQVANSRLAACPPALILMHGLPASGKSWLGSRLAQALGGPFLQTDVRRQDLAKSGAIPGHRDGRDGGLYSTEAKEATYQSLVDDARAEIPAGRSLVIDGSFLERRWREPFLVLPAELRCPFLLVRVTADEALVRERLDARKTDPDEPSEADWGVYQMLKERAEEPGEVPANQQLHVLSGTPLAETFERVAVALEAQRA